MNTSVRVNRLAQKKRAASQMGCTCSTKTKKDPEPVMIHAGGDPTAHFALWKDRETDRSAFANIFGGVCITQRLLGPPRVLERIAEIGTLFDDDYVYKHTRQTHVPASNACSLAYTYISSVLHTTTTQPNHTTTQPLMHSYIHAHTTPQVCSSKWRPGQ